MRAIFSCNDRQVLGKQEYQARLWKHFFGRNFRLHQKVIQTCCEFAKDVWESWLGPIDAKGAFLKKSNARSASEFSHVKLRRQRQKRTFHVGVPLQRSHIRSLLSERINRKRNSQCPHKIGRPLSIHECYRVGRESSPTESACFGNPSLSHNPQVLVGVCYK